MKKRWIVWLVLILILVGCKKQDDTKQSEGEEISMGDYFINVESGTYLLKWNQDEAACTPYFYDKKSKVTTPLCNKANCEHKDSECNAHLLSTDGEYRLKQMLYYRGELYLAYEGMIRFRIAKAQKDGTKCEVIYQSPDSLFLNKFGMCKGKLILEYMLPERDENGVITKGSTINIMSSYDLETKEEKIIANREKKEYTIPCQVGDNEEELYYVVIDFSSGSNIMHLFSYNVETEESTEIELDGKIGGDRMVDQKDYFWNQERKMVESYDIAAKKREDVVQLTQEDIIKVCPMDGELLTLEIMKHLGEGMGELANQCYDIKRDVFLFDDFQTDLWVIGTDGESYFGVNEKDELIRCEIGSEKWVVIE